MTDWEKQQLFSRAIELKYRLEHPQTMNQKEINLLKRDLLQAQAAITLNKLNDEYAEAQRIF